MTAEARPAQHEAERLHFVAVAAEKLAARHRQTLWDTEHALADTQSKLAATEARLMQAMQDLAARDHLIAQLRDVEHTLHVITQSTGWRALTRLQGVLARIPRPIIAAARTSIRVGARLVSSRAPVAPAMRVAMAPPVPAQAPLPPPPTVGPKLFSLADIVPPRTGLLPIVEWLDPIAPEVSIVVYNRRAGEAGLLCVQHLWQNTTGHRYEIILVDNGSDADEIARLQAEVPLIRMIPLGGNRYFGEANNIGVEAARGRYVCLLDSASFVTPGWLEPLMQALTASDEIGAAGPTLVRPDGTVLDAGWLIDPAGHLTMQAPTTVGHAPQLTDALSASCMVLRRADFLGVLGFDLAWDPGSYEAADLCLKLRRAGRRSVCCPTSSVLRTGHVAEDGVSADVIALNRAKFVGRWGRSLGAGWPAEPEALLPEPIVPPLGSRPRALIYTPYPITAGGGERYILTIAQALQRVANVTLVTSYQVSRIRLQTMAREFELDLDHVGLAQAASIGERDAADLAFMLGNEILPTSAGMARHNVFICQFPFPFETDAARLARLPFWRDVELILTYSDYVRSHVLREIAEASLPSRPVAVLTPPVPMVRQRAAKRHGQILNVGRFFVGGHGKRQDAMIDAFRSLIEAGVAAELHFAGSTMPEASHQAYYAGLVERAQGLPVTFHPNCSARELHRLYAESDLYWHATGVGRDIEREPHVVEHFGISVVEAMSAGCIPVVFAAGGPATIVQDGVTGFHFHGLDDLVAITRRLIETAPDAERATLRHAAETAAQSHTEATFTARVLEIAAGIAGIGAPVADD